MESSADDGEDQIVYGEQDRVNALHPIYVIPHAAVDQARRWSETQVSDWMH